MQWLNWRIQPDLNKKKESMSHIKDLLKLSDQKSNNYKEQKGKKTVCGT